MSQYREEESELGEERAGIISIIKMRGEDACVSGVEGVTMLHTKGVCLCEGVVV
jgi:hypothetical protein